MKFGFRSGRGLVHVAPVLALSLLAACDGRSRDGEVPSVSAGTLVKGAITTPREAKDLAVRSALPEAARQKIDESYVPVLVPREKAEAVTVVVEAGFYAYSGAIDRELPDGRISRATIAIQGTRHAHAHEGFPKIDGTHAMRGKKGLFTINEGIATTTWVENGAGYSLDVECSIDADTRCHDESFAVALTNGLAFVGGRP